ncbi:MAG: hypothetical protein ACI9UA_003517, partial [Pseudoalteromonas tetraodonis]
MASQVWLGRKTIMRAPPKTSCGLELDKIPAVFVAKA